MSDMQLNDGRKGKVHVGKRGRRLLGAWATPSRVNVVQVPPPTEAWTTRTSLPSGDGCRRPPKPEPPGNPSPSGDSTRGSRSSRPRSSAASICRQRVWRCRWHRLQLACTSRLLTTWRRPSRVASST
ncbi:hypothetical protein OAO87_00685 [bacterium]|nr:hypothetical protein [bacterium]